MKLEDFLVMIVLKLLVMGYLQEGHDKNIRLVDLVKAIKFIIGPFQSCLSYIGCEVSLETPILIFYKTALSRRLLRFQISQAT